MLLNSLGRRRIWGLENYNIKAYRACHVDEQPYSLTGPGDPWKGESHDLWWHGGGQGQALCQTRAVRQVKPHPRPHPPLVHACTRREPNLTPDSYIATSSPGSTKKWAVGCGWVRQCTRDRGWRQVGAMWSAERGLPAPGTGWGQWRQGARRETVQAASSARTGSVTGQGKRGRNTDMLGPCYP